MHTLPAVTDASHALPGIEIDWVVEEAYQNIPAWHPQVRKIIPVALRRWRRSPWAMIKENEWFRFRNALKEREYDLVLDAQGLMKSGWIALQARGPVAGRSRNSAREPLAASFYRRPHEVDLALPEVEQVRQLFSLALGYPMPQTPAVFGIEARRVSSQSRSSRYAILAHGAAWQSKLWPVDSWIALARMLSAKGIKPVLPWGNEEERCRALRIVDASQGEVLPKLQVPELAGELKEAVLVVGLDTGLTHIAIALGRPTITLYGPSVPVYGELAARNVIQLTSGNDRSVDTERKNTVELSVVLAAANELLNAPIIPA